MNKYRHKMEILEFCVLILPSFVLAQKDSQPSNCYDRLDVDLKLRCNKTFADQQEQLDAGGYHSTIFENQCTKETSPSCTDDKLLALLEGFEPFGNILIPTFFFNGVMQGCCLCKSNRTFYKFFYATEKQFLKNFGRNAKSFADKNITSAVAWPVFSVTSAAIAMGFYFVPLYELTEAVYLTRPQEKDEKLMALLKGVWELGPFLLISMCLAFIAGFFGWIIETWSNKDEFQRGFFHGVFDGFWWSFVSMTTVGYGDKSPKSLTGRLFSVFWILIGITICSMFTAALTTAITSAIVIEPPTIESGSKVGVLKQRLFELSFAISKGGTPYPAGTIDELVKELDAENIDGILLDTYTLLYYTQPANLGRYRATTIHWTGTSVSYGVIFTNKRDNEYFGATIRDNMIAAKACFLYPTTKLNSRVVESYGLFSPGSGLFYPALGAVCGIIFLIFIFGIFYEKRRNKKIASGIELQEKETTHQTQPEINNNKQTIPLDNNVKPFF